MSVMKWLVFRYSQRPVVVTQVFSYGTNKLSTKGSQCLLTLEPWEGFSDVVPVKKAYQDEQKGKQGVSGEYDSWLRLLPNLTSHSHLIFYSDSPEDSLFYFFNFPIL